MLQRLRQNIRTGRQAAHELICSTDSKNRLDTESTSSNLGFIARIGFKHQLNHAVDVGVVRAEQEADPAMPPLAVMPMETSVNSLPQVHTNYFKV